VKEMQEETRPRINASGRRLILYKFKRNRLAVIGLIIILVFGFFAIFAPFLAPYDPVIADLEKNLEPPSAKHLLGTDELGRDILSRIIFGARASLIVGTVSVSIALACGILLGAISGYYGGLTDIIIMRIMDIILSFPTVLLAILIITILGPSLNNAMIAVGLSLAPEYAMLTRGMMLYIKELEFVEAARMVGANDFRIIFRHIMPNCLPPLLVQTTLNVGSAILSAAALGFLGLGAQPPTPEWGVMLSRGRTYLRMAPHVSVFPGLAIMAAVLAFNTAGDGLRDALDPRFSG
jgi:peptide/nickel transport system permease protein